MTRFRTLKSFLALISICIVSIVALFSPHTVLALDCAHVTSPADIIACGQEEMKTTENNHDISSIISIIINIVFFIIGIISVGFIIFGGIKYTMSAGDASKVTAAKNTIMYAAIGLIVSLLAFAIVNFVTNRFS